MIARSDGFLTARRHLSRRDAVLKQLIRTIGPCTLSHNPDRFAILVRSIVSQQISGKAAAAISGRLEQALAPHGFTPPALLAAKEPALQAAGLSAAKRRYLRDLAGKVHDGTVPLHRLHRFTDEEVVASLVQVLGIGRWTAQMFLIFSLARPDVLPTDDLGLRVGVQRLYRLRELPGKKDLEALAEPWRPHRTTATWYFWRSLGGVPQSS
jgi:DNA-3-methyladenine glycosylase II